VIMSFKSNEHTVYCRECDAELGSSLVFCFYDCGNGGFHLIVKPEIEGFLKENKFYFEKAEKDTLRTICTSCRNPVGYKLPQGPHGTSIRI
jgi:hypothetical protein